MNTGHIIEIEKITSTIKRIVISLDKSKPFSFQAGQTIKLGIPAFGPFKTPALRTYSIAEKEGTRLTLFVAIIDTGAASQFFQNVAKEGMAIEYSDPSGTFLSSPYDKERIFIATGTGLAPFISFLLENAKSQRSLPHKVTVFYITRTETELFGEAHFQMLTKVIDNLDIFYGDYSGDIMASIAIKAGEDPKNHDVFLAGNPGILNTCDEMLRRVGVPENQIFYDDFV